MVKIKSTILFLYKCKKGVDNMNLQYEKNFGKNLKKIRENKKVTQESLSTKLQLSGCDITRSAVAKIEVGQRHIYPDEIKLIK